MISTLKLTCPVCKKEFIRKMSDHKINLKTQGADYIPKCSRKCASKHQHLLNKVLTFNCPVCKISFIKATGEYNHSVKIKGKDYIPTCSRKCSYLYRRTGQIKTEVQCEYCNIKFLKIPSQLKHTKHNFCNRSCCAKYRNANKKLFVKISKLEKYIYGKLILEYPNLIILNNDREILNGLELDLYIPSLKLAFELNGIVHYKPIYGQNKFDKINKKDMLKISTCRDKNISLHVLDTSNQKAINEVSCKKYLDIVTSIINKNIFKD